MSSGTCAACGAASSELDFDGEGRAVCPTCALASNQKEQLGRAQRGGAGGCIVLVLGTLGVLALVGGLFYVVVLSAYENVGLAYAFAIRGRAVTARVVRQEHHARARRRPAYTTSYLAFEADGQPHECTIDLGDHHVGDQVEVNALDEDGRWRCEPEGIPVSAGLGLGCTLAALLPIGFGFAVFRMMRKGRKRG